MGHLMNTEFVHWKGRSYKIKRSDRVEMDRIMSNYRPFEVSDPASGATGSTLKERPESAVSSPKPKTKAKEKTKK